MVSNAVYRVQETQTAVKLWFGQIVETDIQPGLHFKVPFMNTTRLVDRRLLTLDAQSASFYTSEKKRLEVDSYVKWRVDDAGLFYKSTGASVSSANALLANRVNDNLRNEVGARTLQEVVSGERDEMMESLTKGLNETAKRELGVEILDVRVKRIEFPEQVRPAVFDRMRADRKKEATQYRSEGKELAEKIRADADREKVVIEAKAYQEAEKVRGEGDAQAASVYANAYNKDKEFYAFVRRLSAYESSFANKSDIMLVDPESDFFKYLNSIEGE